MHSNTHKRGALFAASFSLLALAACGGGPGTSDAGADADVVAPPDFRPVRVSARAMPELSVYAPMSEVELILEGEDAMNRGGRIANPRWTATPATAATAGTNGRFTLTTEGEVSFRGCTGSGSSELCSSVRLVVDRGAPVLMLTAPTPGQELGGDGATDFEVRGTVTDGRMRSLFVNGQRTMVNADGSFSTRLTPRFGMNHVEVVASDGVQSEVRQELDVLWADNYRPATDMGRPSVTEDDAIALQLGRRFFDDGMAPMTSMRPIRTDDLADVLKLVLQSVDRSVLPMNPLVNSSGLTLNVDAFRVPDAQVQINLVDGGLELFIRAAGAQVDTTGSFSAQGTTLSLDGGVTATIAAYARIDVSHDAMGTHTSVRNFTLALEGTEGRFTAPEANALFAVLGGALHMRVEGILTTAVEPLLRNTIPSTLGSVFSALDEALAMRSIPLNTPPLPAVTLTLDGRLGLLESQAQRSMRAGLRTTISTDAMMARFPMARGVPAPASADPPMPFLLDPRMQFGVKLTTLNAALHTLWNSGLFELDLTPVLPMGLSGLVMNPRVSAKLPPLLRPARPGEPTNLVLSIGQLEFTGVAMGVTSRFGVSLDAGVNVSLVDNRIALAIAEQPVVRVWVISETPRRSGILNAEVLRSTIVDTVWPQLRTSVGSSLAFNVPIPPLDSLATIAPSLRGFRLVLSASDMIAARDGYLIFDADLHGELP